MTYHRTQLDNQLRLITQPLAGVDSVTVLVLAGVGSRYETAAQRGLSHFLEHLVFKGTTRRPTSLDITAAVDAIGGEFNAFTGKEYTGFYLRSAAQDLEFCLDLLSDILFHARFDDEEIERERGVILEEMNMYLDSPQDRVGEVYERLTFGNQPLGWEVLGTRETITSMTKADIMAFARQRYVPNNLVVGIVGRFDQAKVETLVGQYFGTQAPGEHHGYLPYHGQQQAAQLDVVAKPTDQAHVVLGVRALPLNHPDRHILTLLNVILGATMSSRLFVEVREKRGLAYAVHTSVEEYLDTGSLHCQLGLEVGRLPEALTVVMEQYRMMRDQPVAGEELQRAQTYLRGRLALSLEDPLGLTIFLLRQELLEGQIQTPEDLLHQLDQVTVADLQRVATNIFQVDRLNLAVIGPVEHPDSLQSLLLL